MTKAEADAADAKADRVATLFKCYNGPEYCEGRRAVLVSDEVFVRHPKNFRPSAVFLAGATVAVRVYVCKFCGQSHVFPVEVPKVT